MVYGFNVDVFVCVSFGFVWWLVQLCVGLVDRLFEHVIATSIVTIVVVLGPSSTFNTDQYDTN